MKMTVQVIIESDGGNTTVQEIARVERGTQRLAQLGLTRNEGKALLKDVQQAMVREQVNQIWGRIGTVLTAAGHEGTKACTPLFTARCLARCGYTVHVCTHAPTERGPRRA